jgi:hypothetical protein
MFIPNILVRLLVVIADTAIGKFNWPPIPAAAAVIDASKLDLILVHSSHPALTADKHHAPV